MMFSMEKCLGRDGSGSVEEADLFTGGGEGLGKEGVPSDEVASAVAAVSDEIGDILKDELGDADRADRIGAELADLSAELGLLAGLADNEQPPDFPSLFEIAMGHRDSGSGSSSSSWSGGRRGAPRRHSRPQRAPRRRPIAKGKDLSRRRSVAARRAACARVRRAEAASDASDVGADSDSDDQWTELDDASASSDSSSLKDAATGGVDCHYQQPDTTAEAPALGQFLLPLLNETPHPDFLIKHEDILQLLASTEGNAREEFPPEEEEEDEQPSQTPPDLLSTDNIFPCEEPPVTPEEEAALLHFVCEQDDISSESQTSPGFEPVAEWLMGVYHSWCEISALMYTLIGTNMSTEMASPSWVYRARLGCHCRLCLSTAAGEKEQRALLRCILHSLAHAGGSAVCSAVYMMRALRPAAAARWDLARLRHSLVNDRDASAIIHEQLLKLSRASDMSEQIITKICLCRPYDKPMEKEYAVERFCKLLENFKATSVVTFQVDMMETSSSASAWVARAQTRLRQYLAAHQAVSTCERLRDMLQRTHPPDLSAWSQYRHRCDCLTPRTLCAQQRKQLLRSIYSRISFFGMMQAVNEFNGTKTDVGPDAHKPTNDVQPETAGELQQGDGTGAKPPDSAEAEDRTEEAAEERAVEEAPKDGEQSDDNGNADLDDSSFLTVSDSDANSGTASLGLSTSSSLDSASELLLAAAAAVESGGSEGEAAPGELCRTVRHLMRSIASIERLMDRVLKHCDEWPAKPRGNDVEARKRVDMGLTEVDRKLMAMYRRLPEVHRRQLQVYRKQKKLSTVCMQLVGGTAPAPPAPGSPPPAPPHQPCRTLCPEYHLQRFKEVRRKVMHMRDQQLYYHRLRIWLEDQLRQDKDSVPESNVTLLEDLPRRKRRPTSPKLPRLSTASKRKLKPTSPSLSKPHKILQMLKHKAPAQTTGLLTDDVKSEVEPPEAFPLEKEDNTDTETIVGEKETGDLCKDMKECLAKFANFALNTPDTNLQEEYALQAEKYPESVSPPLQEMSPVSTEPMPVYTPKPSQRLLSINNFLKDDKIDFSTQIVPDLNVPLNARRTPVLVKDDVNKDMNVDVAENKLVVDPKDPNIFKYVSFGIEIKKAMEECQNIINSYNFVKEKSDGKDTDKPLTLEQICYEVMMKLDKNPTEFLDKIVTDEPIDITAANTKLTEFVENMPQILANIPEIASELANASFELPEFASIMNSLPDVNSEAQLTPETLKQIRELKLSKRDSVKVTKNTAKRKISRKVKNNVDTNDIIGTMTFELDTKDITDLLKDEKEIQQLMKNKSSNKEDFKDLLFSISAQVVINKVFEYLKQNKSPELAKCLEEDKDLFSFTKNNINSEIYSKASTLFDSSVKDALSMDELRDLVKSRFNSWKHYVATKFKSIPIELLENEIEAMLEKFYTYIQDLTSKQNANEPDKMVEKLEEMRKINDQEYDSDDDCPASKESLKQITKLLSTSAGNTFDLLLMKMPTMSEDKKAAVKSLKFKFMDVLKRCSESQQLLAWIVNDPDVALNVIEDLMGFPISKPEKSVDFTTMPLDKKVYHFMFRLRTLNQYYMESISKKSSFADEYIGMLCRLQELEEKLTENISKSTPQKSEKQNASEAEILAAKGLSKIIAKSNTQAKKPQPKPVKTEDKKTDTKTDDEDKKKWKNDALLAKCEAILTSKGEKNLLDSFYTIKSYITQGLPVPETYKKHVISICSSIDAKLLDEELEQVKEDDSDSKDKNVLTITTQNPEELAKYSAQALRNAKQTLNAVAFKNIARNGQSKSESEACDTPRTDCKWTNDCVCNSCKNNDSSVCLGDIVKISYDVAVKHKTELEKKEVKVKTPAKQAKPVPKACENATHQQHVCKVGHNNGNVCSGEGGPDQHCTCCYCTVFGHAPPLTTPVPRNFNETRERLRSILNKKKQQCKAANGEPEPEKKQVAASVQTQQQPPKPPQPVKPQQPPVKPQQPPVKPQQPPVKPQQPPVKPQAPVKPQPPTKPVQPQPKPPALPKTLPPNLTAAAQAKRQALENHQRMLADKMAKMVVTEKPEIKPKALQRTVPIQVNVPPALKTEGKVNPNAMELIRLKQLRQQHLAHYQQKQQVAQQQAAQQQQQAAQQQQQAAQQQQQAAQQQQQKKPEPIYDLPIHNKPTPQQQQLRQQQMQQQQAQQQAQQQQAQQQAQQQQQQQAKQQQAQQAQLLQQQQLQQQQLQQQQLQQQQLQQQQLQQQRQSRPQQQNSMSLSSRDTSVFSTSSGCSGGSCWRGSRAEDTRDLDALLQYIEGPARLVDRGKKRAKKQRQKAKRLESRLLEELSSVSVSLSLARREWEALQVAHASAKRKVDEFKKAVSAASGKKGKKKNSSQHTKVEILNDQLAELTTLMHTTSKEMQAAERQVTECTRQMQRCERQLNDVRAVQGKEPKLDQAALLQKQQQKQQLLENTQKAQQATFIKEGMDGMVRVHAGLPSTAPLAQLVNNHPHVTADLLNPSEEPPPQQKPADRKQTWEQALAHINQLAKGNKEKKKQKQAQQAQQKLEAKAAKEAAAAKAAETPPLSKKQRKLLAKQQAEEEEKRQQELQQQQEAKNKKNKKPVEPKPEPTKRDKRQPPETTNKVEPVKTKKDDKREKKPEKEKKGKENKQEKNVTPQQPAKQPKPPQQPPQQPAKKEKKKEQPPTTKPTQVVNITPHTTIEVVNKNSQCTSEAEKPASCSIMDQLSCGVQVADLRLPPGITLTRVQPHEKKEPPTIKSVPLWKCNQLPATPTPVARPAPVINADPAMMMFSTPHAEPTKPIIVPEPPPPAPAAPAKSKKAKKKAKKAAATDTETKPDPTKMVTLRNPMFHPTLPPVQITNTAKKPEQIRVPDPIPMPPNACQATITPTSNGMYTIRNPLMSMMHQQSLMGIRSPAPQTNFNQNYNYVNPNVYNPNPYVEQKNEDYQNRIMNLASFTQKNDEGYSLFKTPEDSQQRNFLAPEYYVENASPKPVVSPNPIGTRPNNSFESDNSLFSNPIQRPEPIGTPLKKEDDYTPLKREDFDYNNDNIMDYRGTGLYTPFGKEDKHVLHNVLFNERPSQSAADSLPYFQRLRAGTKLNNEVSIHHVTDSKYYTQETNQQPMDIPQTDDSLFSRPLSHAWTEPLYTPTVPPPNMNSKQNASDRSSPTTSSVCSSGSNTTQHHISSRLHNDHESVPFGTESTLTNLPSLEACEREIESFKRFEWYFASPPNKRHPLAQHK